MVRCSEHRAAFAVVLAALLRSSRRRQGLTQAELAERTGGLISKAALANYETGHRSLRVDVFWALARALGEDPGALLAQAERGSGYGVDHDTVPVTVDVASMLDNADDRLTPVRRWFSIRFPMAPDRLPIRTVTLDHGAISALAALMGVSAAQCRQALLDAAAPADADPPSVPPEAALTPARTPGEFGWVGRAEMRSAAAVG